MFYFKCSACSKTYKRNEVKYLCPVCGEKYKPGIPLPGVLEAEFDYEYIKKEFDITKPDWNLFCAVEKKFFPDFAYGNTPFFRIAGSDKNFGFNNLWIKNDVCNPSGSLKDRASFLVIAEANRINENVIVTASTGNAAGSLAAVCAVAGKKAVIFVPESISEEKMYLLKLYGAEVTKVSGIYDDAYELSLVYTEEKGGLNRNTAYNPLTIEGKKTAGIEIFVQNNFKLPDVIVIPVGDGVVIRGIYKAFYDLKKSGLTGKIPKLICVQSENSNAIHNFIVTGKYKNAENPQTIADSISVKCPANAYLAKEAVTESGGFSVIVSDDEILESQIILARTTGVFAEPSSSAVVAALKKISENKENYDVNQSEQIVMLVTGSGFKNISQVIGNYRKVDTK
ncbi:MAG: threonine synthase [Ignavibacteria bacterium]|nr:threonine synthase [Ignavibacteria bacterium]